MSAYFLTLYVYGPAIAIAITAAAILGALSWLVEYLVGRTMGVRAGYIALLVVVVYAARLAYQYASDCKGLFDRPVLLGPCEWSIVTVSIIVALMAVAVPLLIVSQVRLHRWSLRRRVSANAKGAV